MTLDVALPVIALTCLFVWLAYRQGHNNGSDEMNEFWIDNAMGPDIIQTSDGMVKVVSAESFWQHFQEIKEAEFAMSKWPTTAAADARRVEDFLTRIAAGAKVAT